MESTEFKLLIAEVDPDCLASARTLVKTLLPILEPSVILNAFQDIWGNNVLLQEASKKAPIKKRPFPTDALEPEKWQMTVFFLEISQNLNSNFMGPLAILLDRALNQQEQVSSSKTVGFNANFQPFLCS